MMLLRIRRGDALRRPILGIVLFVVLSLSAFSVAAQDDFIRPPAELRFVQLIAEEADVLVVNQPVAEGLAYGILTDYLPYYPENYPVEIIAGAVELSELVRTREGRRYTILALPDALLVLDETTLREAHPAAVDIIIHAAPDADTIDLGWNGETAAEGLDYGEYAVLDAAYSVAMASDGETIFTDTTTRLWAVVPVADAEQVGALRLLMLAQSGDE